MPDTRPPFSPSPPAVAAIGQRLVERLKPMLDESFDAVTMLPGDPAERENDALSMVSTVAAFAGLQLVGRVMAMKQVPVGTALHIAVSDFQRRLNEEVGALLERCEATLQ